uniref:Uncharacterized protein n=1 Tax=Tetranychus urticae TaxID=32264 RepID=T1K2N8_TETUR
MRDTFKPSCLINKKSHSDYTNV